MKVRKVERIERQKSSAMGRWGIPSDFPRHFAASVAIENSLRPMRRGGRISRPDSNRCVRSNVRESQARTLSAGRSARVTSSFSSIRPVVRRTYPPSSYLLFFSLSLSLSLPTVSHFRVCPVSTWKSTRRKREKEKEERECALFLETLFYTSVRLTLNRNERRRLKTRSRVIGALMWF